MPRRKRATGAKTKDNPLVGWAILAAIVAVLALLQHCTIPTGPVRAAWGGLAHQRPPTTIGPQEAIGSPPWQVIQLWVDRSFLRDAYGSSSTVHVHLYECRSGRFLAVEDAYFEGVSTNQGQPPAYRQALARAPPRPRLEVYVSQSVVPHGRDVCLEIRGGSMLGARILGQGRRSSRVASARVRSL
jgi:hypothetical protein